MSPGVDTVLAEAVFAEIAIVLLSFWSLNPGRFFETTCAPNRIPRCNVGNEELNRQTLAANVFNIYVCEGFRIHTELEQEAQPLIRKENKYHKNNFLEKCYRFFLLSFFQPTAHLEMWMQPWTLDHRTPIIYINQKTIKTY